MDAQQLANLIRNVPDFPKPGIQFKDITTLLLEPKAFRYIVDFWHARYAPQGVDAVIGVDARGFIFGAPLAYTLHVPFIPARKEGKLPAETLRRSYELEYGTAAVEIHVDALKPGQRVVLVDDLLATGGTTAAVADLVKHAGAEVIEAAFVVELLPLGGRERLSGIPVHSLVTFHVDE